MIQEFPDILRSTRCVYQSQTVWDGSLDTIKVEKVSVMYGTLWGIVRYHVCHAFYNIWNTSVRSIKLQ